MAIIENHFNHLKPYAKSYLELNEAGFDMGKVSFEILEFYPVADEDTSEIVEEGLNYIGLIRFLLDVQATQALGNDEDFKYGLDVNKYSIYSSRKNNYSNWIIMNYDELGSTTELDLKESLTLFKLDSFFEISDNKELRKEFLLSERDFLNKEIIRRNEQNVRAQQRLIELDELLK